MSGWLRGASQIISRAAYQWKREVARPCTSPEETGAARTKRPTKLYCRCLVRDTGRQGPEWDPDVKKAAPLNLEKVPLWKETPASAVQDAPSESNLASRESW